MSHAQALQTDSLLIGGHYRTFHFAPPKAHATVVFVLHGSGDNGRAFAQHLSSLPPLTKYHELALVYPDGYKTYWNECRKAANTPPNVENIDEQAFFEGMLAYLHRRYRTDDGRALALGFSGGGQMAYKLALTMPDRFRAIVAIVANLPTPENLDCGEARRPVAVMIINGTADSVNPYAGGEVQAANLVLGQVRSTDDTFRYWADLNGYTGQPTVRALPDPDPSNNEHLERLAYEDRRRPDVVLMKVIGGQHRFPQDFDVAEAAAAFFRRQLRKKDR